MASRKTNVKRLNVLYRLFDLLTNESTKANPIAYWLPDGSSGFVIRDEDSFMEEMCIGRQRVISMISFTRTLTNWGFRKHFFRSASYICEQPYFRQGNREDIAKMVSKAPSLNYAERKERRAAKNLNLLSSAQSN